MILPRLACGLAVMRLGGVAAIGFAGLAGLGALGLGAGYLLRSRMKQSSDWAEDSRAPVAGLPPDPE
ncbi:MAG: hypothetical protein INF75_06585 [Roseomonas sp.]|nr:hypothetical protein [Roseomonas sp.]MCA3326873.1 hypothetical protein [Roseomonas sp.]MCA3331746.1 hypothetical protein [Roseomonas sp.]MCA3333323.1 hypothetical protein [Roseomonas sp.]MCA3346039.1 hypothetical protein [Roseomonas sp.]